MARIDPPRDDTGRFTQSRNPRPHSISIRFSPDERRELRERGGRNVSAYIRERAMARRVTSAADQSAIERLTGITRLQKRLLEAGASAADTAATVAGVLAEVRRIRAELEARAPQGGPTAQGATASDADLSELVPIRLSDAELAAVEVDARASKRTPSTYLRDRAMGYPVMSATDQVMRSLLRRIAALQKHWYNESGGQHADTTAAILAEVGAAVMALRGDT